MAVPLVWADRVRPRAWAPGTERTVQPRFRVTADGVPVEGSVERISVGSIPRHDTDFPLHPLAASGDVEETVSSLERDFWNHFGMDAGWRSRKPLVIVQAGPLAIPSGAFP